MERVEDIDETKLFRNGVQCGLVKFSCIEGAAGIEKFARLARALFILLFEMLTDMRGIRACEVFKRDTAFLNIKQRFGKCKFIGCYITAKQDDGPPV